LLNFLPQSKAQEKTYLKIFEKDGTTLKIPMINLPDTSVSYRDTPDLYQFNITLEKPLASNILTVPIETDGLDFLYQPPLDQEWKADGIKYDFVNSTHGMFKGEIVTFRPENMVGSYAVYKTIPKANETGKLYHIYRPLLIDSKGLTSWAKLDITKNSLSIIMDDKFLAEASYPIIVDPAFGYTSIGGSTDHGAPTNYCKAYSTPASNGTLDSLSFYSYTDTGTAHFDPALYSDSGGSPSVRLAYLDSGGATITTTPQWITQSLAYGSITTGTQYWLGFKAENSGETTHVYYKYDSATGEIKYKSSTYAWPDPASAPSSANERVSIFANYTAGGATPYSYTCTPSETLNATSSLSATKLIRSSADLTTITTMEQGKIKSIFTQASVTAQTGATTLLTKQIYTLLSNMVATSIERYATKNIFGYVLTTISEIAQGSAVAYANKNLYSNIALIMYPLTEGNLWKVIRNVFSATSTATTTTTIAKLIYAVTVEIFDSAIISAIAEITKTIGVSLLEINLFDTLIPLIQLFATYPSIEIALTAEEAATIGIAFSIIMLAVCIGLIYTRRRKE